MTSQPQQANQGTANQGTAEQTRHVAFDWGGVFTVGTFDGRSTARLAERLGLEVDTVRGSYFRHVRQLEVGAWTLPQFWEVLAAEIGLTGAAQADPTFSYGDFEALYLGSILNNDPMYALLARLPENVRVGLLSNNYPVVSDHLRGLEAFGRLHRPVFSNEIGVKKPDPASFAALEAAMGVPAAQVAFVDDVQENIVAAEQAGFHGLIYDHTQHEDFERRLAAWLDLPV
jgi:HAD superfamily hydrolase (TIGR01509 family)